MKNRPREILGKAKRPIVENKFSPVESQLSDWVDSNYKLIKTICSLGITLALICIIILLVFE